MLKAIFEPYYIDIFHKFGEVTSKIPAGTILMKDTTNAEYVKVSNGTDFWGVLSQDLYPDPGSEYIKPYNDHRAYSGDQVGIYHKGMFETDQFVVSYEVDDQVNAEGSVEVGEVEVSITGEADEAYHNVKVVFEGEGSSDAAAWDDGVLTITLKDAETYTKTDIGTLITGAEATGAIGSFTVVTPSDDTTLTAGEYSFEITTNLGDGDVVTIAGTAYTAGEDFEVGADIDATATALAGAISGDYTASSTLGVITLTETTASGVDLDAEAITIAGATGATGTAPEGVTTLTVDFKGNLTGEDLAGAEIVLRCVFLEIPYAPGADLYVTSKGKFTNILEEGDAATETSGKVKVGKIVKQEGNKLTVKLG